MKIIDRKIDFEPGDAAQFIADLISPLLSQQHDVTVRPGKIIAKPLFRKGKTSENNNSDLTTELVQKAILDLLAGEELEEGFVMRRKVKINGQSAHLIMTPHSQESNYSGPMMHYRWLPTNGF